MRIHSLAVDVVIFGGGIAGIWTLARLLDEGYRAVLLEAEALGGGQTCHSQCIIHGGVKYALKGLWNKSAQMVADMPARWRACLEGRGEIDLSAVQVWSEDQYLWSGKSISSKLSSFLASKFLKSRCEVVAENERPEIFEHPNFYGQLYRLQEDVVDSYSLLRVLKSQYEPYLLACDKDSIQFHFENDELHCVDFTAQQQRFQIKARDYIFAAGSGNEALAEKTGLSMPAMQRRPLRMSLVSFEGIKPVYAHCIDNHSTPRLTITSHQQANGAWLWYVGGEIAETGPQKSIMQHEADLMDELRATLPWLDIASARIHTIDIDRAEPKQTHGKRPDSVFAEKTANIITAWPRKLTMAPILADEISSMLAKPEVGIINADALAKFPKAELAQPLWEQL